VIHLVTAENRSLYEQELTDLHRARKMVFVDQLGWKLRTIDGMEIDEYDDERAMCAIGFDVQGRVAMNGRFRPTDDGKSMLADHFAHALWPDIGPINRPRTWEFSRALSLEAGVRRHNLQRKAACMLTPLEVALAAGVERYVGFADLAVFPFFIAMGWRVAFLGDPIFYGEGDGAAFAVEVSHAAVEEMRSKWGLPSPAHIYLTAAETGAAAPLDHAALLAAEGHALAALMPQEEPEVRRRVDSRRQHAHNARVLERLRRGGRSAAHAAARTS
jgi:acyl homoserine lactone synthase